MIAFKFVLRILLSWYNYPLFTSKTGSLCRGNIKLISHFVILSTNILKIFKDNLKFVEPFPHNVS